MGWTRLRGPAALMLVSASVAALAQPPRTDAARRNFNLAAGPAAPSIDEFARQAEVNILAEGDALSGIRTNEVRGQLPLMDGLARLLQGTGLVARLGDSGVVFIRMAGPRDANPARSDATPAEAERAVARPGQAQAPIAAVLVVGTRASQQSSIAGKKAASTQLDRIVAEDVGSFPDRNVGEAISRIAGMSLDRGDYNEGIHVGLRGLGSDLIRVEIDGMGVAGAAGSNLLGPDDRGVEFRDLPSDLIKSVDVIKGATAADTEGGLIGSIRVQTRSALDFKRRYVSARLAAGTNSVNPRWGPDVNLVVADRYLDGRLGMLLTLNRSRAYNENHRLDTSTNGVAGPVLAFDFDQSPEKTFSFNPATLSRSDPAVDAPFTASPYALTPRELVTRSAKAATKADCHAAVPVLSQAQLATLPAADRNGAASQRALELMTCLNQWNDYTPNNLRSFVKRQDDQRNAVDLRFDFRVHPGLTLFAKGTHQRRLIWDTFLYHSLGKIGAAPFMNTPAYTGASYQDDLATRSVVAAPQSGYVILPGISVRADGPLNGVPSNVLAGSAVVDATHHVVRATIADGYADTTKQLDRIESRNTYLQAGGTWRSGAFKSDFAFSRVSSNFLREARRVGFSYSYGPLTFNLQPNGLWTYEFPPGSGYSQADPSRYSQVLPQPARAAVPASINGPAAPAYTADQLPLMGNRVNVAYTPQAGATREDSAKGDFSYTLGEHIPVLSRLKFGLNRRAYRNRYWNHNGYQMKPAQGEYGSPAYLPPVFVPTPRLRSSIVPCQDSAGSLAPGGLPCAYGYTPSTSPANPADGTVMLNPQQFEALFRQVMQDQTVDFMGKLKHRPAGLLQRWNEIDVLRTIALSGLRNDNPSCLKFCQGSDGRLHAQPVTALDEKVTAAYLMADYRLDAWPLGDRPLPWGLEIEGNYGVRYVRTRVTGTGLMTLNAISKTAAFDPSRPDLPQGIATTSVTRLTSISAAYTDLMPSFNAAVWLQPDKLVFRYGWAEMIARHRVSRLTASGACTFDERLAALGGAAKAEGGGPNMTCTGRVGNPGLRPLASRNQNFSLEYYPDRDTQLSLAHFRHNGIRGGAQASTLRRHALFQDTDEREPGQSLPLAPQQFTVPSWDNGAGMSRVGWEVAGKTAFSFLPWRLRHTGIDFNLARIRSRNAAGQLRDLNSGEVLPPTFEPRHTYNVSLWYDDGVLRARLALQVVADRFWCIAPCGNNEGAAQNYPADGASRVMLPYAPGLPVFGRETRYVDAKVSYRVAQGIEIFADGRNLGKTLLRTDLGKYAAYANGTPMLLGLGDGGARYSLGLTLRY